MHVLRHELIAFDSTVGATDQFPMSSGQGKELLNELKLRNSNFRNTYKSEIRLVVSMNLIKRPILIYLLLGSMLTLLAYCTQMLM